MKKYPYSAYQLYFATEEATKELNSDLPRLLRLTFRGSRESNVGARFNATMEGGRFFATSTPNVSRPNLLTEAELKVYEDSYLRTGMGPALNYYRTRELNFKEELEANLGGKLHMPVFQLTCGRDPILKPEFTLQLERYAPGPGQVTRAHVPEANHWVLQEFPEQVLESLLPWMRKLEVKAKL